MKKIILLACLVCVFAFSAQRVSACSCAEPSPNAFVGFEVSDAVFVGKAIEVKEVEIPYKNKAGWFTVELEVKFRVERTLKGLEGSEVILRTGSGCCSCGYEFEKGQKYLVYAYHYKGMLNTNYCTRTKPLAYAAKDLEEIGKRQKEEKKQKAKQSLSARRSITSHSR
jgi:hypothetical protein